MPNDLHVTCICIPWEWYRSISISVFSHLLLDSSDQPVSIWLMTQYQNLTVLKNKHSNDIWKWETFIYNFYIYNLYTILILYFFTNLNRKGVKIWLLQDAWVLRYLAADQSVKWYQGSGGEWLTYSRSLRGFRHCKPVGQHQACFVITTTSALYLVFSPSIDPDLQSSHSVSLCRWKIRNK